MMERNSTATELLLINQINKHIMAMAKFINNIDQNEFILLMVHSFK